MLNKGKIFLRLKQIKNCTRKRITGMKMKSKSTRKNENENTETVINGRWIEKRRRNRKYVF